MSKLSENDYFSSRFADDTLSFQRSARGGLAGAAVFPVGKGCDANNPTPRTINQVERPVGAPSPGEDAMGEVILEENIEEDKVVKHSNMSADPMYGESSHEGMINTQEKNSEKLSAGMLAVLSEVEGEDDSDTNCREGNREVFQRGEDSPKSHLILSTNLDISVT